MKDNKFCFSKAKGQDLAPIFLIFLSWAKWRSALGQYDPKKILGNKKKTAPLFSFSGAVFSCLRAET
ncbi:MAG: hypothetical protein DRJ11_08535 [Candidatus Aminicenantes bacterium]|nr:MAG: hypothetical protein DRJ11_08535 [Candidatus Aminicenantes bacterium]